MLNYAKIHEIQVANRMETAVELYHSRDRQPQQFCQPGTAVSIPQPYVDEKSFRQMESKPIMTSIRSMPTLPKNNEQRPTSVHFNYYQQQFAPPPLLNSSKVSFPVTAPSPTPTPTQSI